MYKTLMKWMQVQQILPQISSTERQALRLGMWIDGQFFAGKVDFDRILTENYDRLCASEQAFIDGPVEELCQMVSSYELSRTRKLPDAVFKFMADNGFLPCRLPRIRRQAAVDSGALQHHGQSQLLFRPTSSLVVIPNSLVRRSF